MVESSGNRWKGRIFKCNAVMLCNVMFYYVMFRCNPKTDNRWHRPVSDVMDSLFVQTPTSLSAQLPAFGWYKLQSRVKTHPVSLCKRCTVAQDLSVCLAGFARGKNAHKTSLGVLRKNWCTTSWDLQLPFAKKNAIWDCQSRTRKIHIVSCLFSHRCWKHFLIWK